MQLEAAWEELHPAICMIFRRSKGAVAVRETTPASAPLMNTDVADPPERSWLSHVAAILAVGFSADAVRPLGPVVTRILPDRSGECEKYRDVGNTRERSQ